MQSIFPIRLFTLAAMLIAAAPARAQAPACPPTDAKVASAVKVPAAYESAATPNGPPAPVTMGDTIEVTGTNLGPAATCGGTGKPLVLVLGGHALADVQPFNVRPTSLRFTLVRDDASKDAWAAILGRPETRARTISVSIGTLDGQALPTDAEIQFVALPEWPFGISVVGFGVLLATFFLLAARTNILREGNPDHSPKPVGQFSLSKTQAAWWFFVVLASYLLIGLVTGDFKTSLNGTALTLLAIGGGTAIGSAAIASSRNNSPEEQQAKKEAADTLTQKAQALDAAPAATPDKTQKLAALKQSQAALAGCSQGFLIDILSDADGVCFHRFQNVAWTVTLTGIFISAVYKTLAMPDFDATLLGLLGLSSLTYLGLKPTEATIPKAAKTTP